MRKCAICHKGQGKKGLKSSEMFQFPTHPKYGKALLNKWKKAAGWPLSRNPRSTEHICADHFRDDQMESVKGKVILVNRIECYPTIRLRGKVDSCDEEEKSESYDDDDDDEILMRCVKCHKSSGNVKVFEFPLHDTVRLNTWKEAAGKTVYWNPTENVGICEHHFALDQFVKSGNIEPGEELELLPDANPIDFGKCYVCFKNGISRCPNTLKEKSKHSDRLLLQVFETIVNSRVIIPSIGLCYECYKMLNEYELHIVQSQKIQSKIAGFLKERTVDRTISLPNPAVCTIPLPIQKSPTPSVTVTNPNLPIRTTIGQVSIKITKPSLETMKIVSATSLSTLVVETKRTEPIAYPETSQKKIVIYPKSNTMPNESVYLDTDESSNKMFLDDNLEETVIQPEIKVEIEPKKVENVANTNILENDIAGPSEVFDDFDDFSDLSTDESLNSSNSQRHKNQLTVQDKIKKHGAQKESGLGFGIMICVTCSREYNTKQSFVIHKKLHNVKSEHLDCEICGKLIELKMYVTHVSQCFGDIEPGSLKCALKTCDMEFETIEELSTHMQNHPFAPKRVYTKRKKLESDDNPSSNLKKKSTKKYKYADKRFPCDKCGKMIGKKSEILHMFSHEKDHLKVKKKEPKYPRKKIKRNGEPYRNKRIPCPVCYKLFDSFKLRTVHQYVHLGYTPYKCPICLRGLSTMTNVKQHIFIKHRQNYEPPDIYICTECPENVQFNSCDELGTHMNETHRKQKDSEIEPTEPSGTNTGEVDMSVE